MENEFANQTEYSYGMHLLHHDSQYQGRGRRLLEENRANHWSIIWSDFIFILLVILFAYAVSIKANTNEDIHIEEKEEKSNDERPIISHDVRDKHIPQNALFEITKSFVKDFEMVSASLQEDNSVKLSIEGPLFFDSGAADLKPSGQKFLHAVANIIRETEYKVHVVGHTDDVPIHTPNFASNWELSLTRAAKVTRYLIEKTMLEPERFAIMGYSMYQPMMPNTTAAQRARNRRVEIIITREHYTTLPVIDIRH